MILEVADIRITPGRQAEFDAAIAHGARSVLALAEGYLGHEIRKGVESPERYLLLVRWATLEAHTVGFRESEAFGRWRAIVGPFFAAPPVVEHFTAVDGTPG
ncbi:antibiotic biosynthesis monooxygenase [Piscinibacter sakaiensis]|uniref:Antibiotic biosynthesis monooxygenase n=1 Tax=Piscinibacter sakaiensis TaxID=1547922 RepID=A0A0K8P4Q0_PISS1|nr:antibiotic biosynthesis monooxygenase [Piscinibacter sakaiensis]GAP37504.1 antibiotic biosynthesis monooxygenase [Piscinibacter sakaiensis]